MKEKTFSTFDIAKFLDVYPTTVAKWIDEGRMKAFTTPGGHRRVRYNDLLNFLKEYRLPIPDELLTEKRKKVLIVDDDELVLDALEKALEKFAEKYEVYTARDGFQAGAMVGDFNPEIVILDIFLPGIDGFEVCRNLKQRDRNIKIIAITGFPSEENKRKILKAGADACISKPIEIKELVKVIEKVRGRK